MPLALRRPPLPSKDERSKTVSGAMRRHGSAREALLETLDTVQESFGRLDKQSLKFVADSLRVPLRPPYGIAWTHLIIATGQNNAAMNRCILQAARHFARNEKPIEGMLNRVEAVIRWFDPCVSCSTHADGQPALRICLLSPDGKVLDEVSR